MAEEVNLIGTDTLTETGRNVISQPMPKLGEDNKQGPSGRGSILADTTMGR